MKHCNRPEVLNRIKKSGPEKSEPDYSIHRV